MNRYHRWYCNSGRWARRLETTVMPWVLRDADLGADLLEVGPGPGLTTDLLRQREGQLTSIEIDHALAEKLKARLAGTNVTVVEGDATRMPFDDGRFTGAVCMTMLHHVPAADLQDRLLREVFRVLRPGARFVGSDSTISLRFRLYHLFDTMVLVDPEAFAKRLEAAGFEDVSVRTGKGAFRWQARKPG
jgi:SAM-dependent methyltransferase